MTLRQSEAGVIAGFWTRHCGVISLCQISEVSYDQGTNFIISEMDDNWYLFRTTTAQYLWQRNHISSVFVRVRICLLAHCEKQQKVFHPRSPSLAGLELKGGLHSPNNQSQSSGGLWDCQRKSLRTPHDVRCGRRKNTEKKREKEKVAVSPS